MTLADLYATRADYCAEHGHHVPHQHQPGHPDHEPVCDRCGEEA